MRAAMAKAVTGDDVYGEDPEVNRLEATLAALLGKEAGLFVASGTQSNLSAILAHCARGEEVLVGQPYHVCSAEAAGASVLGGVALHPLPTGPMGEIAAAAVTAAVKPDDPHFPVTRLLSLENTVSGQAIPLETLRAAAGAGREAGLSVHLDGARFFNAITALGCPPEELAALADTVSVCLSKGLGSPAGSVLVGPADLVARARRTRKMLGGGMRQAGVLAAAGLHALEHHVERLAEDHARAERLAGELAALEAGDVSHATNMVFFTPAPEDGGPLRAYLAERGIVVGAPAPALRLVTHLDVDGAALEAAIEGFRGFYRN
jgi:threonine aldolase